MKIEWAYQGHLAQIYNNAHRLDLQPLYDGSTRDEMALVVISITIFLCGPISSCEGDK